MTFPTVKWRDSSQQATDATSHTVSMDTGSIASGDLIIVHFCLDDAVGDRTLTWPTSPAWTQLRIADGGSQSVNEIRYRVCDGTEAGSITVTSNQAEESVHRVWCITTGTYNGNPEAAAFTVSSGTTTHTVPALSPSWGSDDTLWLAVSGAGSAATYNAYPTNYSTQQFTQSSGGSGGVADASAERELNASSEDPDNFTTSGSTTSKNSLIGVRGITADFVRTRIIIRGQARQKASRG